MRTGRGQLSAVSVDGKVYAIGGARWPDGEFTPDSLVEQYDPASDTWRGRHDMTLERITDTSSTVVEGKIYTVGGLGPDVDAFTAVEVYDPNRNRWEWLEDSPMPSGRANFPAVTVDGTIYTFGGGENGVGTSDVESYDPSADEWEILGPLPTPLMSAAAAAVDGVIYVMGGETGAWMIGPVVADTHAYNPATDTWLPRADMPTPRMAASTAVVGDRIYVVGGLDQTQNETATVEIYSPTNNTWELGVDMPSPRVWHDSTAVDGHIYVMGGYGITALYEFDTGHGAEADPRAVNAGGRLPERWGALKVGGK